MVIEWRIALLAAQPHATRAAWPARVDELRVIAASIVQLGDTAARIVVDRLQTSHAPSATSGRTPVPP